jgi:hypothetical protein
MNIHDAIHEDVTEQEIYDFVIAKLRAQKVPSFDNDRGSCRYHHPSPTGVLCCAVGHLIPDGEYSFSMENRSVDFILELIIDDGVIVPYARRCFLRQIQRMHDRWALREDATLEAVAQDFCRSRCLRYTPPQP